jgi:hypothetical protein
MMDAWTVRLNPEGRKRLDELEERVERLGAAFWAGVRHGSGINRIHDLLIEIGRPAHIRRVRILARIRYILAETYAHAGYSSSAIEQALTSLLLSRAAYHDSHDPYDLGQFARAALIVSHSSLLRHEPQRAAHYLDLHGAALERIEEPLGAEYLRQRGAVAFLAGTAADDEARENFRSAMTALESLVENGRHKEPYEVLTIGQRQANLVGDVNWEGALELVDYMRTTLSPGAIQIIMNVNWAAACGLSIDSPRVNQEALDLLAQNREASVGFGHQATIARLLELSPALPPRIRRDWVRYSLYQNTFRDY